MSMRRGNARRVYSTTPGFAPTNLSGLVLWTRSDTVVGSPVSQWTDLSGNGNHLVAAGGNRPAYVASDAAFGSLPSLTWDGAATSMHTTGNITLGALSYILVVKCPAAGGYFAVFKDDSTDYFFTTTGLSSFILRGATNCSANLGAGWGANANARTICRTFDGTVTGHKIRANGVDLGAATAGSDPGTSTTAQTFYLGSNQTPGGFMAGSFAECIVYNRALPDPEMLQVEAYLRARYGHY